MNMRRRGRKKLPRRNRKAQMKPSRFALLLLLFNGLFLAGIFYWVGSKRFVEPVSASAPKEPGSGKPKLFGSKLPKTGRTVEVNEFRWSQLESEDYHEYIARLRKIGCPEETIRDIIISDLDKLFAPQVAALRSSTNEPKYWKADEKDLVNHIEELQRLKRKRGVDYEKRQVVRELLGVDLVAERSASQGEEDFYGKRLGGAVAPEKLDQLRVIIEENNQEQVALREKSWREGETLTTAEKQQLRALESEKQRQLESLLSPEELEQYNLWFSGSAYKVRDALAGMDGSEQEFLALYKLRRAFDEKWADMNPEELSPSLRQAWNASLDELEENVAQALGPEHYQAYARAQDPDYRQLRVTAAEFSLPTDRINDVYGFKQTLAAERQALLSDRSLPEPVKMETLQRMQEESQRAVVDAIGPKAYQYYLRTGAGKWLTE
jgi:hypothetical protein